MRKPSERGLEEVQRPAGFVKNEKASHEDRGTELESSEGVRKQWADPGIHSLPPPIRRGSTDKEREKTEEFSKEIDSAYDEEAAKEDSVKDSRVEHASTAPIPPTEMTGTETKPGEGRRWSRRKWLIVFGVVLVIIIAVVVAVVVTRPDDSTTAERNVGGGTETSPPSGPTNQTVTPTSPPTLPPGTSDPQEPPATSDPGDGNQTLPPLPPEEESSIFPTTVSSLDENLLQFTRSAAELCHIVNLNNTEEILPNATVFSEEPDKALVVQVANTCFGVFRGTTIRIDDWLQNFDRRMNNGICSNLTGECCNARQGFVDAYNTSYRAEFEAAFNACVDDCPSCHVVFAGHSQGGAIAQIAGVKFDHLDPVIMTFGQPFTMDDPCPPINRTRMYRFVNTVVRGGKLLYDPIPYTRRVGALAHFGHTFILGEDVNNVAYYEDGPDEPLRGRGEIAIRHTAAAHLLLHYRARLATLLNNGTLPISVGGFSFSETCQHYTECAFPRICGRRQCTAGQVGDPCDDQMDCLSGNCTSRACM